MSIAMEFIKNSKKPGLLKKKVIMSSIISENSSKVQEVSVSFEKK